MLNETKHLLISAFMMLAPFDQCVRVACTFCSFFSRKGPFDPDFLQLLAHVILGEVFEANTFHGFKVWFIPFLMSM